MTKRQTRKKKICIFVMLFAMLCTLLCVPSFADETTADIDYNLFNGWNLCPQVDFSRITVADGIIEVLEFGIRYETQYVATATTVDLPFSLRDIAPYIEAGYTYLYKTVSASDGISVRISIDGNDLINNEKITLTDAQIEAPLRIVAPVDADNVGNTVNVTAYFQFFCVPDFQDNTVSRAIKIGTPFSETEAFVERVNNLLNSSVQDAYNQGYQNGANDVTSKLTDRPFPITEDNLRISENVLINGTLTLVNHNPPDGLSTNWINFADLDTSIFNPPNGTFNQYSWIWFGIYLDTEEWYWNDYDVYVKNDNGRVHMFVEAYDGTTLYEGDVSATDGEYVKVNLNAQTEIEGQRLYRIVFQFYGSADSNYKPDENGGFYLINTKDPYYDVVKDQGYNSGYKEAENNYASKLEQSREEGYKSGYQTGYDTGFTIGWDSAEPRPFYDLIFSVFDAPMAVLKDMLNFDILGINLATVFAGFVTVFLFVTLMRYVKP